MAVQHNDAMRERQSGTRGSVRTRVIASAGLWLVAIAVLLAFRLQTAGADPQPELDPGGPDWYMSWPDAEAPGH